ncbi:hypothetical protein FS749_011018 [Ceratobasidium sp. UAMH 11750]|nr:hypothetical protein FS749_011018 [Ceratobasidium sp. UAMH 11750]
MSVAASKVSQHERGLVATFRANTPPGGNVNLTAFKVPARNGYKDALSQLKKTVAGPPQYTTQVDPPSMWIKFHRDLEYHLNLMLDIIDCDPMVFMKTAGYINPTMMALLIDMKDII